MPVVKLPDSIVSSPQNVPPTKFVETSMVSCEISSLGLQLPSQLETKSVFTDGISTCTMIC